MGWQAQTTSFIELLNFYCLYVELERMAFEMLCALLSYSFSFLRQKKLNRICMLTGEEICSICRSSESEGNRDFEFVSKLHKCNG